MNQATIQRIPILAEVTNLQLVEAEVWFHGMEGLITKNGRTYAIIGWAYNENMIEEYW